MVTGSVSTPNINQMNGFTSLEKVFASSFHIGSIRISIIVVWWFVFVAIASWVLLRTRVGNWIYAVGGNQASARAVGVPVVRVKIGLFMTVSFLAWFMGMHTLYNFNTIQAGNGVGIMPHPEHAVEALTGPSLDGLGFFTSVVRHLASGQLPAEPGAMGAVGAEETAAHRALLQAGRLVGRLTADANPRVHVAHFAPAHARNFPPRALLPV